MADFDLGEDVAEPRPLTTGQLIKKKKEIKKWKKEKLIEQLEKKEKKKQEQDPDHVEGPKKKKKKKNKGKEEPKEEPSRGRKYTLSLALPGSILDNAQSPELRTYLAGQVARAIAVFNVDEVVVFDDEKTDEASSKSTSGAYSGVGKHGQASLQLARLLQYLECPQYLRKHFFPLHPDLKYAGVLNPTDMPHHLRANESAREPFREGIVLDKKPPTKQAGSLVSVGLHKDVVIDRKLQAGLRVTVRLEDDAELAPGRVLQGRVVSPAAPRETAGLYWGYTVRLAASLSEVLAKGPYQQGYDLTVGTSERGESVDKCSLKSGFKHLLVVFGGVKGLEAALAVDQELDGDDPAPLFDRYLNTCPDQGSRTIRTEEALLVTLAALRPKIASAQQAQ